MFLNFIKVTLRTLSREKVYAFINISGLSLAVAFCLIIGLYLRNELTYDKHNTKHKQIYRLVTELNTSGKIDKFIYSSQTVGRKLADEYADVKDYVRFLPINRQVLLQYEDKSFYWSKTAFVSKNVFEVFDHEFIYGDPETARTEPFCAVSESFAKKYWGNENPIGKIFTSEGNGTKVTHVFKDLPVNSHYKYDVLYSDNVSFLNPPEDKYTLWKHRYYTYLVMSEDYNGSDFEGISDSFYKRHMIETGKENNMSIKFMIEPLADIHYHSDAGYDLPKGNRYYLYGFTAVAIFILLVACINYMNLATARAARRLKEVGMRKVLGSGRLRLITQFLGESVFFAFIAMFAGYAIVELVLNLTPVNELMQTTLVLNLKNEPMLLGWMLIFCLGLGIISGMYPAFYLSTIAPVSTLIKKSKTSKNKTGYRELLVLVQFIISVTVIACTIIITLQMQYVSNKALGFEKESRLIVTLRTGDLIDKVPLIKKELLKNKSILGASICDQVLGDIRILDTPMVDNNDGIQERAVAKTMYAGKDFIKVMGIELLEGRDFPDISDSDKTDSYIVNQAMVNKMGWKQPLGKYIRDGEVIGVVRDFHFDSLREDLAPLVIRRYSGTNIVNAAQLNSIIMYLVLNVAQEKITDIIQFLKKRFESFDAEHPFEFQFLDDSLNKMYLSEQRLMKLAGIFAGVCIFISCLGLFGLAAFTTEQRSKEIGVRKVLGASTLGIIAMLTSRILLLVIGGSIIASLLAFFAMDEWLTGFAYKIDIPIWVFFIAAAVAAVVAFITIALQAFKTAQANPVKALRYE